MGEAVFPLCCLFGLRRPIASMVWLKAASKRTHSNMCLPGLLLPVPMFLFQATADPCDCMRPSSTHRRAWFSLLGLTAPFPCVLVHTRFCWCTPRLCFPHSCGNPGIKSHCPSKSDSLGIPSAFANPQVGKSKINLWMGIEFYQKCLLIYWVDIFSGNVAITMIDFQMLKWKESKGKWSRSVVSDSLWLFQMLSWVLFLE